MAGFRSFIQMIRARPVAERRIMALASYLAMAAVIIAVWVISLGRTLQNVPPASLPASAPEAVPPTPAGPAPELATPFESFGNVAVKLRTALGEILQNLGTQLRNLNLNSQPQSAANTGSAGQQTPAQPATPEPQTETPSPPSSNPNSGLTPLPFGSGQSIELFTRLQNLAVQIFEVIRDNFSMITNTFSDLIRYLSGR